MLVVGDGSAAQVGALANALLITEKSNVVETVGLRGGAVSGPAEAVAIPAGSDTPSVSPLAGPTATSPSPIPMKSGW